MPAESKKQQKFMGMVDAYKKGKIKNPSPAIKKAAKSMTTNQVKDFASTSRKGLPVQVSQKTKKRLSDAKKQRTRLQ